MQKSRDKKLVIEDKFDRKYACWANNHKENWHRVKVRNRRQTRRKLKAETMSEIREEQYHAEII